MRGTAGVAAPLADPHPVFDAAQGRRDIVILGCSTAPAVLNTANEECVDAFLAGPPPEPS